MRRILLKFSLWPFEVKHIFGCSVFACLFLQQADDSNPKKGMQKAYQQKVDLSWFVRAFTYLFLLAVNGTIIKSLPTSILEGRSDGTVNLLPGNYGDSNIKDYTV